jgi:UDP-N-acetylmuramoyl-L-alanyl-D-glutamate--2,6-diaminopimelate ligase
MLAAMVDRGCAGAVLELDQEALAGRRAEGVALHSAVATDLGAAPAMSLETIIERRRAAARTFRQIAPGGTAVVNADDSHAAILGAVNLDARYVAYSLEGDSQAQISGRILRIDRESTRFLLRGFSREVTVCLRLAGVSGASCALAAASLAWASGVALDAVVAGLESVSDLPGRLATVAVDGGHDFEVRIDEARHPAELQQRLRDLRSVGAARVHCVFGAEGEASGADPESNRRSRAERRALAAVAESLADRVTITTDNPRAEDPDAILDDLLSGFRRPGRVRVEPDRRLAIEVALADAAPGDAVLIAGKGRRTFQIHADRAVPFDDADVARAWLRMARSVSRRSSA